MRAGSVAGKCQAKASAGLVLAARIVETRERPESLFVALGRDAGTVIIDHDFCPVRPIHQRQACVAGILDRVRDEVGYCTL